MPMRGMTLRWIARVNTAEPAGYIGVGGCRHGHADIPQTCRDGMRFCAPLSWKGRVSKSFQDFGADLMLWPVRPGSLRGDAWPGLNGLFRRKTASGPPRWRKSARAGSKATGCGSSFRSFRGLGRSATAQHYGIADLNEARTYLAHEVLGPRLIEISKAMLAHDGTAPETILGPVDAMKLRSCATLFRAAGGPEKVFGALLDAFFDGQPCDLSCRILEGDAGDGARSTKWSDPTGR